MQDLRSQSLQRRLKNKTGKTTIQQAILHTLQLYKFSYIDVSVHLVYTVPLHQVSLAMH